MQNKKLLVTKVREMKKLLDDMGATESEKREIVDHYVHSEVCNELTAASEELNQTLREFMDETLKK